MGIAVTILMVMVLVFLLAMDDFKSALAKATVVLAIFGITIIAIIVVMF